MMKLSEVTDRRLTVSAGYDLLHPVPVLAALVQKTRFAQPFAQVRQIDIAEMFLGRKWQLEGRTLQMVHKNFEVIWLDKGVLGRASEEVIGMLHDELVERSRRRDQYRA